MKIELLKYEGNSAGIALNSKYYLAEDLKLLYENAVFSLIIEFRGGRDVNLASFENERGVVVEGNKLRINLIGYGHSLFMSQEFRLEDKIFS